MISHIIFQKMNGILWSRRTFPFSGKFKGVNVKDSRA